MKKVSLLYAVSSMFLIACGDSSGDSKSAAPEVVDPAAETYATEDDLLGCIEKFEGNVALVDADSVAFKCEDGRWVNKGKYIATEENIKNCTSKREGEIAYIVDEDKSLVCQDGKWVKASAKVPEPAEGSSSSNASSSSWNHEMVTGSSSSSEEIASNSSSSRNGKQGDSSSESNGSEPVEGSSASSVSSSSRNEVSGSSSSNGVIALNSSSSHKDDKGESSSSVALSSSANSSSSSVVSSSSIVSSSSTESSSSSLPSNYNVITDSRDGRTYKTVKIGTQEWMAENLNFDMSGSECYDASASNCARYGRLYTQEAAYNACPNGWHLPNTTEWKTLISNVNPASDLLQTNNSSGFAALLAGSSRNPPGAYAIFWTSDANKSANIGTTYYNGVYGSVSGERIYVRCLKGEKSVVSSSSVKSSSSAKSSSSVESSSSAISSSSSVVSSSSVSSSSVKYGTLIDTRDGKSYKTIEIGEQTWMAQNLNYLVYGSHCYNDSVKYCTAYGRLYSWALAVGKTEEECGDGHVCNLIGVVQGVCPEGWHLPDTTEWNKLFEEVGGKSTAGTVLKSKSGWMTKNENGTDDFAFTALPVGRWYSYGKKFQDMSREAYFWSSTENRHNNASYVNFSGLDHRALLASNVKSLLHSVRCIKD